MANNYGVRCQHAGIHVLSLPESIKWYSEILGFTPVPTPDSAQFNGCFPPSQLMRLGDFYLEMYECAGAGPFSFSDMEWTVGVKHLSFSVERLDELMEELYRRGDVKIMVDNVYSEAVCGVKGGDRAVYLLDNSGMLVELSKIHGRG